MVQLITALHAQIKATDTFPITSAFVWMVSMIAVILQPVNGASPLAEHAIPLQPIVRVAQRIASECLKPI